MKKNIIKKVICLTLISIFLISTNVIALKVTNNSTENRQEITDKLDGLHEMNIFSSTLNDFDPQVDIEVTVTIKEIRAFDKIDIIGDPDFYVKLYINGEEFTSPTWNSTKYVKDPEWSATANVPDDVEDVDIKIQLWDSNIGPDRMCDISKDHSLFEEGRDVELTYNIKRGYWWGDDNIQYYLEWDARGDPSGYGRLNGCDDNTIYTSDLDCELWFDITQNDKDGDGIPYWFESYVLGTDPGISDLGMDYDEDGIPIEWEWKWGHYTWYNRDKKKYEDYWIYDPFEWDNHSNLDPDNDGLDNVEEYKAAAEGFLTDPFRKDILLEIDQMKIGPDGQGNLIPELSKELLTDPFDKHNIVFQIDDQGQTLPFDYNVSFYELQQIYFNYFLNGNESYWRRGAFHYAPIVYRADHHPGFMWPSIVGEWNGGWDDPSIRNCSIYGDCFQVATRNHDQVQYRKSLLYLLYHKSFDREYQRAIVYASAMMHETGHVLGIYHSNTPGCDNRRAIDFWNKDFWIWRTYKSCMNYAYTYIIVDYSDGSHGKNDFDDWSNIDLTLFQTERNWFK